MHDKMRRNKTKQGCENMMSYLLLLLMLATCYQLAKRILLKVQLDKYQNKSQSFFQTKEIQFKHMISKFNLIKTKEIFLSKQGYPFHLDVIRYYSLKIIISSCCFLAGCMNYGSVIMAIFLAALGYFLLDLLLVFHKKTRDSEICQDLFRVTNSLCLQLSAQVSLQDSLSTQYEQCQNADFRKAMMEFATYYELSEFNMELAIRTLKQKFDLLELDLFGNALCEYHRSGHVLEILENLAETLKEKQMEQVKQITRNKVLYITLGVMVALGNIILLTFYPLFVSVGQGFQQIFQ